MSKRQDEGERLFREGYNCCQAVFGAFAPFDGLDKQAAMRLSAPLGGGVARLRMTCGAVTGMCMAAGLAFGDGTPADKAAIYEKAQELCAAFRAENRSLICAELLEGVPVTRGGAPEARTEAYYEKRPCAELVRSAIGILEARLGEKDR